MADEDLLVVAMPMSAGKMIEELRKLDLVVIPRGAIQRCRSTILTSAQGAGDLQKDEYKNYLLGKLGACLGRSLVGSTICRVTIGSDPEKHLGTIRHMAEVWVIDPKVAEENGL